MTNSFELSISCASPLTFVSNNQAPLVEFSPSLGPLQKKFIQYRFKKVQKIQFIICKAFVRVISTEIEDPILRILPAIVSALKDVYKSHTVI